MPIQFRCAYCQQLLGIARRKAGTVISCPTCGGRVIVPKPPERKANEAIEEEPEQEELLERSDFDVLFNPPAEGQAATPVPGAAVASAREHRPISHRQPAVNPQRGPEAERRGPHADKRENGVFLSTTKVMIVTVAVIVLLAASFLAGLMVGRQMWPGG
jgi:DNA-directed RNA polymerase subunit RPC12/RpoP